MLRMRSASRSESAGEMGPADPAGPSSPHSACCSASLLASISRWAVSSALTNAARSTSFDPVASAISRSSWACSPPPAQPAGTGSADAPGASSGCCGLSHSHASSRLARSPTPSLASAAAAAFAADASAAAAASAAALTAAFGSGVSLWCWARSSPTRMRFRCSTCFIRSSALRAVVSSSGICGSGARGRTIRSCSRRCRALRSRWTLRIREINSTEETVPVPFVSSAAMSCCTSAELSVRPTRSRSSSSISRAER